MQYQHLNRIQESRLLSRPANEPSQVELRVVQARLASIQARARNELQKEGSSLAREDVSRLTEARFAQDSLKHEEQVRTLQAGSSICIDSLRRSLFFSRCGT